MANLNVDLGGMKMKNPVMPGSGTYDYFDCNANVFPVRELGAVMIKSVHRLPREGNCGPRITEVLGGMINAVGIPSVGIERFVAEQLPRFGDMGTNVVLSLSGNEPRHYFESLEILDNDPRISAVELNLSCPNVGSGLPFSADPHSVTELVSGARRCTKLPLYIKLSPNIADIRATALASEDSGADAVTISNTFRAMKIDIDRGSPVLGNISGGISGPAIKPLNMLLVYQAAPVLHIPIIASGGIATWQDAVEYIMAGATALEVGCMNFVDPMAMPKIIRGLNEFMDQRGFKNLHELRGLAHRTD